MATDERTGGKTAVDEFIDDIRRELVRRVAASDRDSHRDVYDALEDQ